MGIVANGSITSENFVGRTETNTSASSENEDFANTQSDINELNDGSGGLEIEAAGSGDVTVIPNLAPIILNEGWNTFGYTLPYDYDFPTMLLALLHPEYWSTSSNIEAMSYISTGISSKETRTITFPPFSGNVTSSKTILNHNLLGDESDNSPFDWPSSTLFGNGTSNTVLLSAGSKVAKKLSETGFTKITLSKLKIKGDIYKNSQILENLIIGGERIIISTAGPLTKCQAWNDCGIASWMSPENPNNSYVELWPNSQLDDDDTGYIIFDASFDPTNINFSTSDVFGNENLARIHVSCSVEVPVASRSRIKRAHPPQILAEFSWLLPSSSFGALHPINTSSLEFGESGDKGLFYFEDADGVQSTLHFSSSNFAPIPEENISGSLIPINIDGLFPNGSASGTELTTAIDLAFDSIDGIESFKSSVQFITSEVGSIVTYPQLVITNTKSGITPNATSTFDNITVTAGNTEAANIKSLIEGNIHNHILHLETNKNGTPLHSGGSLHGKNVHQLIHESGITVVKNNAGQLYWPEYGFNGIGDMERGQGYQIRVTPGGGGDGVYDFGLCMVDAQLQNPPITDFNSFVNAADNPIDLIEGWNIIAFTKITEDYPGEFNVRNILDTQMGIVDKIEILKDNNANIYWPEYNHYNNIGDFIPGQGYQIRMKEAISVQFPLDTEIAVGLALVDQFTEPPIL